MMECKISFPKIFDNVEIYSNLSIESIKKMFFIRRLASVVGKNISIVNITYITINKNTMDAKLLSSAPSVGMKYWQSGLWKHEQILDLNEIRPIYNREISFNKLTRQRYYSFLDDISATDSFVFEYGMGQYKDAFIVVLSSEKEIDISQLYYVMHEAVCHFYSRLQGIKTYFNLSKFVQSSDRCQLLDSKFNFYQLLKKNYEITRKNYDYLYGVMLGLSSQQMSMLFNRSPRTIENSINRIKSKLGCLSKLELQALMKVQYIQNVSHWIEQNKKHIHLGASGLIIDFVYPYTKSNRLSSAA
ncbi:MAG: hypothetical protein ACO2ZM_00720 [Francisellaceae bacterium]